MTSPTEPARALASAPTNAAALGAVAGSVSSFTDWMPIAAQRIGLRTNSCVPRVRRSRRATHTPAHVAIAKHAHSLTRRVDSATGARDGVDTHGRRLVGWGV